MVDLPWRDFWICSDETREFFEVLTHDDRNSKYVVACSRNGQWSETSVHAEALGLESYSSEECAFYVTRNGFTGHRREVNRCRQINAMMFDLDCHKGNHAAVVPDLIRRVVHLVQNGVIPDPNLFVNTGRGVQLYYVMEQSTPYRVRGGALNERGISFYRDVEKSLSSLLEKYICSIPDVTLDTSVYDFARVGRIPGSYNPKAQTRCELINAHRRYYALSDLRAFAPKDTPKRNRSNSHKHVPVGKDGHLLVSRLKGIEKLQEYRKFHCVGSRENMCFIYYNTATQIHGPNKAFELLLEFNARFVQSLPESDMAQIKRTVDSVVIQYGKHKGECGFYPLRVQTIIEKLNITGLEMSSLGLFNSSRRQKREAAKERTRIRRQKRDKRICELYAMGYKQKQVACMCKCSLRTVKTVTRREGVPRGNLDETRKAQLEAMKEAKRAKGAKNCRTSWVVKDFPYHSGLKLHAASFASGLLFLRPSLSGAGACLATSPLLD